MSQPTHAQVIWAALHDYRENSIPPGDETYDAAWDDICASMAHIEEDIDRIEQADATAKYRLEMFEGRVNRVNELVKQRDEMLEALREARSVIASINRAKQHAMVIEDEIVYWQRKEWCDWALGEVLPIVDDAMAMAKSGGIDAVCLPVGIDSEWGAHD